MLGGSFCSRGSENARNGCLIVPTIAHSESLASSSPCIKSKIVKAIDSEEDPKLAEPMYIELVDQFNKLILDPLKVWTEMRSRHKIIVIDAVDECTDLRLVLSLIRLILKFTSAIPLKVFIGSRDEPLIRCAFTSLPELQTTFCLHEVEKDVVKGGIQLYLEMSLAENKAIMAILWMHGFRSLKFPALVDRSGTLRLFIYAVTAIRFISQDAKIYKSRHSALANRNIKSVSKTIDGL